MALAQHRIIAVGQARDEFVRVRHLGRMKDFLYARVRPAERDVVIHRVSKHHGFLLHISDLRAVIGKIYILNIDAIDQNIALITVVKAHEQIDKRRLARTGRADNADDIARFNSQIDIGKRHLGAVK